ncbi:MAG: O-methyltransferase [Phycisphaeraceae bacterium]|nr:O-methyltransferase [Phycisphaeraceae bacterium]
MTKEQWEGTSSYLCDVFGTPAEEAVARTLREQPAAAARAGLPAIAISADVGRLLSLLARLATRSPNSTGRIVEVGTLGGYSGIWMARALPAQGRLITVEREPKHAEFAMSQFEAAGLADRVEIVVGPGLERLPELVEKLGPDSVDMIFLDADKGEYPEYARILKPALRRGGVLTADNMLSTGSWWVTQASETLDGEAKRWQANADRFNRLMAGDADFETGCFVNRQGVLVAVRR